MIEYFLAIAGESFLDYFSMIPFFLIIEALFYFYYKKKGILLRFGFLAGWHLLVAMICAVFYITGAAGLREIFLYGTEFIRSDNINLIPFIDGTDALFGLIMNCLLFLPFGILIPLLWQKDATLPRTVFCGFTLSLLIELSQLFNFRATDIDDLLMNTLGTVLGFGIYKLLFRKCTVLRTTVNDCDTPPLKYEAFINIFILFLFYFLFGTFYLNFFHRLYYGF